MTTTRTTTSPRQ